MPSHMRLRELDDSAGLTLDCGELPADEAVVAAGHEPNGYFWEGMVRYLAPGLADRVELDSEAGMFAAYADRSTLVEIQVLLEPYLDDGPRVAETIRSAESTGFAFDD